MYNPSALSKATGFLGASLIDTAMMGGFGGVASGSTKAIAKAGIGVGTDFGIREFIGHKSSKDWSKEEYAQESSKEVFGDADALQKIQTGSAKYRKSGTEFIDNINSALSRKIKVAPFSVSDSAKKASNCLLFSIRVILQSYSIPSRLISPNNASPTRVTLKFPDGC